MIHYKAEQKALTLKHFLSYFLHVLCTKKRRDIQSPETNGDVKVPEKQHNTCHEIIVTTPTI